MSKKKFVPIKYTNREFNSIKEDLVNFAERYYPNIVADFTTPSFSSMVLDSVAYVGDMLSYYIDYSVNESFLDTALEFNNVRKHASALGYNYYGAPSSFGQVAFFVEVPANSGGTAPDLTYLPTLKKGSIFGADGLSFILTQDVVFNDAKSEFVATGIDSSTGLNTFFAVKAYGEVQSGVIDTVEIPIEDSEFEKFKKVKVGDDSVIEVLSVFDSNNKQYYQVENLSQEVIFVETTNKNAISDGVASIIKPFVVSRRFVVRQDNTGTYLQFGFGSENEQADGLLDPASVAIKMHGRRQISDSTFDPAKLLRSEKMGVSPTGTTLTVKFRSSQSLNTSVGANTLSNTINAEFYFENENDLDSNLVEEVRGSLELTNEEPITSANRLITIDEIKERAKSYYATQARAVTKQDYESLVYSMPPAFGAVKRVTANNDFISEDNKVLLYIVSEDSDSKLSSTSVVVKNNIKNWLKDYKSLNDKIEIEDAKIINFRIEFRVVADRRYSNDVVMFRCLERLKDYFSTHLYIGEPLYLTEIYNALGKLEGVADVQNVKAYNNNSGLYSNLVYSFSDALSGDGTYYYAPKNGIFELKYPDLDIKGVVV